MAKLNALALGYAAAAISALCMLLLGIGWNLGIYVAVAEQMAKWHMLFSPSIGGIIGGMVEASIWSFLVVYGFGWLYNKWA